jgi:hypothetical protein
MKNLQDGRPAGRFIDNVFFWIKPVESFVLFARSAVYYEAGSHCVISYVEYVARACIHVCAFYELCIERKTGRSRVSGVPVEWLSQLKTYG